MKTLNTLVLLLITVVGFTQNYLGNRGNMINYNPEVQSYNQPLSNDNVGRSTDNVSFVLVVQQKETNKQTSIPNEFEAEQKRNEFILENNLSIIPSLRVNITAPELNLNPQSVVEDKKPVMNNIDISSSLFKQDVKINNFSFTLPSLKFKLPSINIKLHRYTGYKQRTCIFKNIVSSIARTSSSIFQRSGSLIKHKKTSLPCFQF